MQLLSYSRINKGKRGESGYFYSFNVGFSAEIYTAFNDEFYSSGTNEAKEFVDSGVSSKSSVRLNSIKDEIETFHNAHFHCIEIIVNLADARCTEKMLRCFCVAGWKI